MVGKNNNGIDKSKVSLNILFICLGNICRSPAAHAVMQYKLKEKGIENRINVDSAGIGNWHVGQLPDSRMQKQGTLRGYHINHHARQFNANTDFDLFDKIIVMDEENYRDIIAQIRSKEDKNKVFRMAEYFQHFQGVTTVPDPYYGTTKDFNYVLDLIEDGCDGILKAYFPEK